MTDMDNTNTRSSAGGPGVFSIADAFTCAGHTYYVSKIESALCKNQAVSEVALMMCAEQDQLSVRLTAFVCLREGYGATCKLIGWLRAETRDQTNGHATFGVIQFLDKMPRNAGGNIAKAILHKRASQDTIGSAQLETLVGVSRGPRKG